MHPRHYLVDQKLVALLKLSKLPETEFDFIAAGRVDSLSLLNFVLDVEDAFHIELTDAEVASKQFRTFGGLSNLIFRKLP